MIEKIVFKSWWVILFFLLSLFGYNKVVQRRNQEEDRLKSKLSSLTQKKKEASTLQEELKRQIASQEDEAWIEMTLMRRLGLVPEGQIKVHFNPRQD